MKKYFLFLIAVIFISASLKAQVIVNRAGPANTVQDQRLAAARNFILPRYTDTTQANSDLGLDSCGAKIYTRDDNSEWYRQCSPKAWVRISSSANGANCGLNAGGIVTWSGTNLVYNITSAQYCINANSYYYPGGQVTLGAPHATLDRFDAVVLTTSGTAVVIAGTPDANPQIPSHDPATQLYLTAIQVRSTSGGGTGAGTQLVLWDENTGEPFTGEVNVNIASGDFNSTVQVSHLTKSTNITTVSNNGGIRYFGSNVDASAYNSLSFDIYLKAAISNANNLLLYIGTASPITLSPQFGFDKTAVGYQTVTIPFTALSADISSLNNIRFNYTRSTGPATHAGFYIDYIRLTGGVSTGPGNTGGNYISDIRRRGGTDSVEAQINGIWYYKYKDSTGGGGEPSLGNPLVDGYVLSSTISGVRSWVAQSGGSGSDYEFLEPALSDTSIATATANTTLIQNTITAAKAAGKGVRIPKGSFYVNQITIDPAVPLVGAGRDVCELKSASAVSMIKYSDASMGYRMQIRDITFNGKNIAPVGWDFKNISNSTWDRCGFFFFDTAIVFRQNVLINELSNTFILGNQIGIYSGNAGPPNNLNHFNRVIININSKWAVKWYGGSNVNFYQCDFEANGTLGDTTTGAVYGGQFSPIGVAGGIGFNIKGSWFEQNKGKASVWVESPATTTFSTIESTVIETPSTSYGILATGSTFQTLSSIYSYNNVIYGLFGSDTAAIAVNGTSARITLMETTFTSSAALRRNGGIIRDYTGGGSWTVGGDALNSAPVRPSIGPTTNVPMIFLQNNTERMRIDSIGGNLRVGGTLTSVDIGKVSVKSTGAENGIYIEGASTSQAKSLFKISLTGSDSVFTVDRTGKNLKLGPANTAAALDAFEGIHVKTNNAYQHISITNSSGVHPTMFATPSYAVFGTYSNHEVRFGTNSTDKGVITTGGLWRIGDGTTPTALLHLKAGTTTTGTAPIKFSNGNQLTTPEAGVLETQFTELKYSQGTTEASRGYVEVNRYLATATGITLDGSHGTVDVTATGQTITLPTAVGLRGRLYTIKLTASGTATVNTTSSQTIDGSTTYSLSAQWKYVTVQSDNANWIIIGNN